MNSLNKLQKYQIIQLIIVVVFILMLLAAVFHPNNKKQKKLYSSNYVYLPALMDSDAKYFLDNMVLDLNLKTQASSTAKNINLGPSKHGGKYTNEVRKLNGYIVTPTSPKAYSYFKSKSFKLNQDNISESTFNSIVGFTNGNIICLNSYSTISESANYKQCGDIPTIKCTADSKCITINRCIPKSETFCADLNQ